MPEAGLLLQRTLADLILEPKAEVAFDQDPMAFGERRGLDPLHQAALLRFKDRLAIYRELGRANIEEALENVFPLTKAALGSAWEECTAAFLASHSLTTPFYRDIAPTFVEWLERSRWAQARWPFLVSLAHFECMEILVLRWPDEPAEVDLEPQPAPERRLVLSSATQVLTYAYAVHEATQESPIPQSRPTHLLAYQDAEDDFQVLELTPATAALLVRSQEETLALAAQSLGLPSLDEALALLEDLAVQGALRGFRG